MSKSWWRHRSSRNEKNTEIPHGMWNKHLDFGSEVDAAVAIPDFLPLFRWTYSRQTSGNVQTHRWWASATASRHHGVPVRFHHVLWYSFGCVQTNCAKWCTLHGGAGFLRSVIWCRRCRLFCVSHYLLQSRVLLKWGYKISIQLKCDCMVRSPAKSIHHIIIYFIFSLLVTLLAFFIRTDDLSPLLAELFFYLNLFCSHVSDKRVETGERTKMERRAPWADSYNLAILGQNIRIRK